MTWHVTIYTRHVTCDIWHVTCDTWHMTCNMWHVTNGVGYNIVSEFYLPSSYSLSVMMCWRFGGNGLLNEWINERMLEMFVEQPPGYTGFVYHSRIRKLTTTKSEPENYFKNALKNLLCDPRHNRQLKVV